MSHAARQHQGRQPLSRTGSGGSKSSTSLATLTASRPVASPLCSPGKPTPSGAALKALHTSQRSDALQVLQELEGAKVDGATLKHSKIYELIGALATAEDGVGIAAKALRRKWRIL